MKIIFAANLHWLLLAIAFLGTASPSDSYAATGSDYSRAYVQKAYVAYYGRPADPAGLAYWASQMDAQGQSLSAIIAAFGNSKEFITRYGGLSNMQLVTKIYQQTLGRNPDQGGLDYYVGELAAGRRTLQSITLDVLFGASTPPDSTVVANKLAVAAYYTDKVAAGCPYGTEQDGVNALSGVTAISATVAAAKAAIDSRCGLYPPQALTLIAGTANSPGSQDGTLQSASLHDSNAMTFDAQGNLYVVDGCGKYGEYYAHGLIRKISPAGVVTSIAGSASYAGPPQDGVGELAKFKCITGVTAAPDGNLYVIDGLTQVVQRITPAGQVTTFAGTRNQNGSIDGPPNTARFSNWPGGIAADKQGNLFVADNINHTIRKVDILGNATTYAGQAGVLGSADGALQVARFQYPNVLSFDSSGKLYVGDQNGVRVIANGSVSTLIPVAQIMTDMCGNSSGLYPNGIDVSSDGRIALAYSNCRTVGIYQNKQLSVLMGEYFSVDDLDGSPSASRFYFPSGVAFAPNGDLLISDFGNSDIKRYSASTNSVGLYAGQRRNYSIANGAGKAVGIVNTYCLVTSPSGDYWFSQEEKTTRKSDSAGNVSLVVDEPHAGACVMKINDDGTFVVAARYRDELRLYSKTGVFLRTLATGVDFAVPFYSAVNAVGDIFFGNGRGGVSRFSGGIVTEFARPVDTVCHGCTLNGMAFTTSGDLVVARQSSVVMVSPSGIVTELAGSQSETGLLDGPITTARFRGINGLAIGSNGAIYVAQAYGSVIRRIYNGQVDTIAGTPMLDETRLGLGPGSIYNPRAMTYDSLTNSLIIGTDNAILRAQLPP